LETQVKRPRRQASPFSTRDVHRVSEYFDGDLEPTYVFVQSVWLPAAIKGIGALNECMRRVDLRATLFMCDHLRQGAISVGARTFCADVELISTAVAEEQWIAAAHLSRRLVVHVAMMTRWLKRRLAKFSSAASAYQATQHLVDAAPPETQIFG
jgi:hypothetical protein